MYKIIINWLYIFVQICAKSNIQCHISDQSVFFIPKMESIQCLAHKCQEQENTKLQEATNRESVYS